MPVCQVCQHNNPTGAEYCEECGAALTAPVGASAGAASAPASSGPSSSGASGDGAPSGAPSAGAPPPGTPTGGTVAPGASATSPDALGEAAASVGTTLSGAGDVGVTSDDVEAASANANAAPPTTGAPAASGTSPAAGPQAGSAPTADTSSGGTAATTPSGTQQARLVAIRYGAPTGQEIPLLGQRLVIGRFDPETGPVDIDLSEVGEAVHVSRQHGELYREADGRWLVRDLGSTNGIFVKGSGDTSFGPRITAPRPLANGDEVTFGNARFVFRTD